MKNRDYKQFAPDCYYHVYNRGNGKQEIFRDDQDYRVFLWRFRENLGRRSPSSEDEGDLRPVGHYLRKSLPADAYAVVCYCLMPNHFHFLLRQNSDLSISQLLLKVCTGYSKYFNKKYKLTGHVFQDEYKAIAVGSDPYLLWLSAYIHANPLVAGLVRELRDYPWSSYPDYLGLRKGTLCEPKIILEQFPDSVAYEKFVNGASSEIKQRKELQGLLLD